MAARDRHTSSVKRVFRRFVHGVNTIYDELLNREFLLDEVELEEYQARLSQITEGLCLDSFLVFGDEPLEVEFEPAMEELFQSAIDFEEMLLYACDQMTRVPLGNTDIDVQTLVEPKLRKDIVEAVSDINTRADQLVSLAVAIASR